MPKYSSKDFQVILDFLRELRQNNSKDWMDANKQRYQQAKAIFIYFIEDLIKEVRKFDGKVGELTASNCIFRINRDIRFSKNKDPYKTNFGAYISPGGKNAQMAGYYIHLEPEGQSMCGGGIYLPPTENLKKIRQEIDYNIVEFKKIINEPAFVKHFKTIQGEQLKNAPKGYPSDHPDIGLLKYKSYFVGHTMEDKDITASDFVDHVVNAFKTMTPLNTFFNQALS